MLGETYTDDVIQVMESVRDNPVTVARSANAVGKSHAAARICTWFYTVFPDSKVFTAAAPPLENLKQILWGEIMSIANKHAYLFDGHYIKNLSIARQPKSPSSFIVGLTIPTSGTAEEREAKFSGKHAPHMLFVVDEGDAVPDEVYKGIESCMSGGYVRMLVMFNPRRQVGPVYLKEKNKQANVVQLSALRHPNVVQGKDVIPGAVTRNITVRRVHEWTRPFVEGEKALQADIFEVPDFLAGHEATALDGSKYPPLSDGKRVIEEPSFHYMVLGRYPTQSVQQLIPEAWINAAVSRWHAFVAQYGETPPPGVQPVMGVDIGEFGTDSNVACLRYGDYVAKLIPWSGVDMDLTAKKSLDLYIRNNVKIAHIDGTGVGAGVAPAMARNGRAHDVRAVNVKVSEKPTPYIKTERGEFQHLRDQLWWAVREWLRTDPAAMLPPDGLLIEELKAAEYEKNLKGKIVITDKKEFRSRLHRSPDRADALCLTFNPVERPKWTRVGDAERLVDLENQRRNIKDIWERAAKDAEKDPTVVWDGS